jgi:hypothetical protein
MRRDLMWFIECSSRCNGTVTIEKNFNQHIDLYLDALFSGMGACWGNNVYTIEYEKINNVNITHLVDQTIKITSSVKLQAPRTHQIYYWSHCHIQFTVYVYEYILGAPMKLAYMIPRVNKELKQAHLSCP